ADGAASQEDRRTRIARTARHARAVRSRLGREAMVRKRTRWVIGAAVVAASMTLTGVAIATGPTGSVVTEVIGAGSLPNGAGFAATPDTHTIRADFHFAPAVLS